MMRWEIEGRDWPNRDSSRFVGCAGIRWHVQIEGRGPPLLLLHGTGASTHSFRDLLPLLARDFTVVAPDLPGHAFSRPGRGFTPSLPAIAASLSRLLKQLELEPRAIVGHSAGAAIAARMSLDGGADPEVIVSLAGAFVPFAGLAGKVLGPAARLLARNPLIPRIVSLRAGDRAGIERLLRSTGSVIDPRGVELYQRLARQPAHVAAVLAMMANWDLEQLMRDLPRLRPRLVLLAGELDTAVPVRQSRQIAALVSRGQARVLPGLGHLLHEEAPVEIAAAVAAQVAQGGPRGSSAGDPDRSGGRLRGDAGLRPDRATLAAQGQGAAGEEREG